MSNNRHLSKEFADSLNEVEQEALLAFWEIDLTAFGGGRHFLHNGLNQLGRNMVLAGRAYEAEPIIGSGFEFTGQGASNRPTVTVSNLFGRITGMAAQFSGLLGGVVNRREISSRYLDAVNFKEGNPKANAGEAVLSRYVIERLSSRTRDAATFELAIPSETVGAKLPGRTFTANICVWSYRGEECGYTGRPVADYMDEPTREVKKDECSRSPTGCRARYGANGVLPFGGFVSINKA